jgi:hypothetical protein
MGLVAMNLMGSIFYAGYPEGTCRFAKLFESSYCDCVDRRESLIGKGLCLFLYATNFLGSFGIVLIEIRGLCLRERKFQSRSDLWRKILDRIGNF